MDALLHSQRAFPRSSFGTGFPGFRAFHRAADHQHIIILGADSSVHPVYWTQEPSLGGSDGGFPAVCSHQRIPYNDGVGPWHLHLSVGAGGCAGIVALASQD